MSNIINLSKLNLEYLYTREKKSIKYISKKLGVSAACVRNNLKRYDIYIRGSNELVRDRRRSQETKDKIAKSLKGVNNYHWKPDGSWRLNGDGYVILKVNNKRVAEHRYVLEQYLGRKLETREQVHHINENMEDNRIKNLILFSSGVAHRLYHWHPERVKSIDILFNGSKL